MCRDVAATSLFVGELLPTPCPVVREHLPTETHHISDGDGMLHSLLLAAGGDDTAPTALCSRYVQTCKYLVEREAGKSVLSKIFSGMHGVDGLVRRTAVVARVITGQMELFAAVDLANTSLAYFGGRLFALGEPDLPYAIHLSTSGDLITLGRWDFGGKLSMGMTAHPKKDPITGEVFAFRCGPVPPFVTHFPFDADGKKQPDVPIFSVWRPSFLHDFAITETTPSGFPFCTDTGKVPRVGILPRYAASDSDIMWFDVPGFNPVHTVNAWEEDGGATVVPVAPNVLSVEHAQDRMELIRCCVEMVRIELKSGAVSRTPLSAGNLDFGVINPNYLGRRNRYAYVGVGGPQPKVAGVVKLDLEKKGGDCVAFLHDENTRKSSFLVMDARSPDLEVVAEVSLHRRVPYGFHGIFVKAEELRAQKGEP
ncbi:unnamed protein product [Spirodela intermedia]|uniref:Uncharacterized protein n=1 Tax=Spirodela intermedia TaxID=51605 RepID=A0A7I8JSU2_SPIIN|nr:unnamed protein product [Spirodela intermedia]CAA6673248.1 unnamed protein product [Spirodela intermedia]